MQNRKDTKRNNWMMDAVAGVSQMNGRMRRLAPPLNQRQINSVSHHTIGVLETLQNNAHRLIGKVTLSRLRDQVTLNRLRGKVTFANLSTALSTALSTTLSTARSTAPHKAHIAIQITAHNTASDSGHLVTALTHSVTKDGKYSAVSKDLPTVWKEPAQLMPAKRDLAHFQCLLYVELAQLTIQTKDPALTTGM